MFANRIWLKVIICIPTISCVKLACIMPYKSRAAIYILLSRFKKITAYNANLI